MFHLHIDNSKTLSTKDDDGTNPLSSTMENNVPISTPNTSNIQNTITENTTVVIDSSTKTNSSSENTNNVVKFSIGRRNYEILSGTIRLFRENGVSIESAMDKSRTLLIVAVPSRIAISDLCTFLGPHLSHIEHIRIIKDYDHPGRYMVLLRMINQEYSTQLYKSYNGRTFTSFDPEVAHILYVAQIRITSTFASTNSTTLSTIPSLIPVSTTAETNFSTTTTTGSRKASIDNELLTTSITTMKEDNNHTNELSLQLLRSINNHSPPLPSDPLYTSLLSNPNDEINNNIQIENCIINSSSTPEHNQNANSTNSSSTSESQILTELPTCPVCLERLDSTASGMLTTLCNHTFHCNCLTSWKDDTCPVCRYCLADDLLDENTNTITESSEEGISCEVCGVKTNLWLCLVCGHTGCGRYEGEHAMAHYRTSGHTYAIELSSQRVWDYTGDGYVHRLIHNKADGKVIELPDPMSQYRYSSGISPTSPTNSSSSTRPRYAPDTDVMNGDITREKIDSIAFEYTLLLTHQLESQRTYFESMLTQLLSLIPNEDTERRKEAESLLYSQHGLTRSQKIVHPSSSSSSSSTTFTTNTSFINEEHSNIHSKSPMVMGSRRHSMIPPITLRSEEKLQNTKNTNTDPMIDNTIEIKVNELEKLNTKLNQQNTELEEHMHTLQNRISEAESKIITLERERRTALRQVGVWKDKVDDLTKEITFLKEVNENQSANVKQWQTIVTKAETKEKTTIQQAQLRITELEEQVRDLMFSLDTQHKLMNTITDDNLRNDISNGQILITDNNNTNNSSTNNIRARLAKKAAARNSGNLSTSSNGSTSASTTGNHIDNKRNNDNNDNLEEAIATADAIAAELLSSEKDNITKTIPLTRTTSSSSSKTKKK